MSVNALGAISALVNQPVGSQSTTPATGSVGFAQFLANAVDQANQVSNAADATAASYVAGGPVTMGDLMVAEQKASLALDLVVQVRNRAVSAYQSIMSMQI